ncbi:DUF3502 domain-containing protein [uncultured Cetobacterium sp.]|uniref:DUF3502 domain-containing protein n=1 Tax=uncultured Cetobacterium sp. TaxID=527638 RepID=UPI0026145095|nr:DUF3502 domain-containing protein [uncultured Cetobacterium sp.]
MSIKISLVLLIVGILQNICFANDYKISKVPIKLSILAIQNGKTFDENWIVFKEAFKDTNVKLKSYSSKNLTDEIQAFNLAVSSGSLPDIISLAYPEKLESLGMDGGIIPLNDLIEKHAPNIKSFFKKYPRYKMDAVAADGNIYFIPDYYDWYAMRAAQGLFIRKDWINKLGLKIPETMEELYDVMIAFKTKDPNQNGKMDEIPYFERSSEFADKELIGLFGAEISFYVDENETVIFGPTTKRFKEAVPQIVKWYREGLIDPEIFTRGFQSRDYMLRNDLGGITFDWFASTESYNKDTELKEKVKDFEFIAIIPPMYAGKSYAPDARTTYLGGWGISATCKDPILAIKYFDYWFSDKGYELSNWGVENDTFIKDVNGKNKFTDTVIKSPGKTPLQVLREKGIQFRIGALQDYGYEKAWGSPTALEWAEMYMENGCVVDPMPTLKYTKDENRKIQKINSQLNTTVKEMNQKWILGAVDFDKTYDEFLKRLNEIGLKEAIEINQRAYERFMKNNKQ